MDGLCVYWGNLLRLLGKVNKTVYWAIDFVPENRFKSHIKNLIYHWINVRGYKNADEMWDLSPRMAVAREKYLGVRMNDYKSHKVVPYGAWTKRIKKYQYNECEKNTLVFMGHLIEKQGVQLVMNAIPELIKNTPDFRFKIIGDGHFKDNLIALANDLRVINHCDFKGKIHDHLELEKEIAKSCLAIAPYIKELDTWTQYTDPGKVKTYLACGVPVLLTDVPWNAKNIEDNRCGKIISESHDDIVSAINEFMRSQINQEAREQANKYSHSFDYEGIFDQLAL
jgi:glycosyltransferase involved in cell wall biosynthesis